MGVWGINNYQPRWCNTSAELSNLLIQTSLIGLRINSLWSLWNSEEDTWFDDAPVVICTATAQFEFCANKADEFSFSLDSIDLGVPVYWGCDSAADAAESSLPPLYWVQARNIEFEGLVGKSIAGIEIVESENLHPSLTGIALKFEDDRLEILNGLDCNLLARTQHPWQGLSYTLVESKV